MEYSHRMVEIRVTFNGLYEWGGGWVSATAANRWDEYLSTKVNGSFWSYFRRGNGLMKSNHLISTSANVFLHPMSFHTYIPIEGTFARCENGKWIEEFPIVKELFTIARGLAEYCGGTAEMDFLRVHEFTDNGMNETNELDYNIVCK